MLINPRSGFFAVYLLGYLRSSVLFKFGYSLKEKLNRSRPDNRKAREVLFRLLTQSPLPHNFWTYPEAMIRKRTVSIEFDRTYF